MGRWLYSPCLGLSTHSICTLTRSAAATGPSTGAPLGSPACARSAADPPRPLFPGPRNEHPPAALPPWLRCSVERGLKRTLLRGGACDRESR
jgi:hypothetical protein